jgi:hypothetical protein
VFPEEEEEAIQLLILLSSISSLMAKYLYMERNLWDSHSSSLSSPSTQSGVSKSRLGLVGG